jgi:hypothetical protein
VTAAMAHRRLSCRKWKKSELTMLTIGVVELNTLAVFYLP